MSRATEIAQRVPHDRPIRGAEIGVRYGKNAEQLLELLPGLTLYLVDRWEKPPAGDSYYDSGDGIAQRPPGHLRKALRQAHIRCDPFGGRVEFMQMESGQAVSVISNEIDKHALDFVFLDADHSYDGVTRDIRLWLPMIRHAGLLCGHDYDHPRIGEVKRAVDERFGNHVELGTDMTWFYRVQWPLRAT